MAKREHPKTLELVCDAGLVLAEGSGPDGKPKLPTFAMVAYTGGVIRVAGWWDPIVIDLTGVMIPTQKMAVRRNHDPDRTVGHTTSVAIANGQITAEGVISFATDAASEVVDASKNGFPWQASVGIYPKKVEFIPDGISTTVNGQLLDGPLDVVRASNLREISFVDLGADADTSVSVAASAMETPDMTGKASTTVQEPAAPVQAGGVTNPQPGKNKPGTDEQPVAQATDDEGKALRAKRAAELRRCDAIEKLAAKYRSDKSGELAAKAVEEDWTPDKAELELMRAARPTAPAVHAGQSGPIDGAVIEAAVCSAGGLKDLEKRYDAKTLEAAHKLFHGRVGLQEIIAIAANAAGWAGRSIKSDLRGALQAAFSTLSLPGILGNTANKFLLAGFTAVERVWQDISSKKNVSDFKTNTSYRLSGGFEYDEVGPDGELKHGTVSEDSFTNRARTYGKMFAITRQDIINDDLGALTDIPMRIGRGAALKLNKVFWAAFLDNSTFFTSARGNYFEGAGTTLQTSQLEVALALFRNQTDPDGNPVAIEPQFLLVPPALEVTAQTIFNSAELRDTTASTKFLTKNPFMGRFRPIVSVYLSNSLLTGNSTTAWYLLANPSDLSTIEVAFLNGVMEPTVETAEADFNVLGIQMRGYHDFGVALQEYRAGVKSKGAA